MPSGAIDVLMGRVGFVPIGTAVPVAVNEDGLTLWRLIILGKLLPDRWVVIDGQFVPARVRGRG